MQIALETLKTMEKETSVKLTAAENLKLKWVKWWGEEKDRAGRLEK